jgi:hypothetical protein
MRSSRPIVSRISLFFAAALAAASALDGGCYRSSPDLAIDTAGDADSDGDGDGDADVDEDADVDGDTDVDEDADVDSDSDSDADCGFVDEACCDDGTCADTDALCLQVDTEGNTFCYASCEPDVCDDEGFEDAACYDVSAGNGLGICYTMSDLGTSMSDGNACEATSSGDYGAFNGYCCPESMGGDGLGFGPVEEDAGVASVCDGVDMSSLEAATSYADLIECGVGICLSDGAETEWCGVPCTFDNTCDVIHSCMPLDATGEAGGYCYPM